jgi:hypothetical protein
LGVLVGWGLRVGVLVALGRGLDVGRGVLVGGKGVLVGAGVSVGRGVKVAVRMRGVLVGVTGVGVLVGRGVFVGMGVCVGVSVTVNVGLGVLVGVAVGSERRDKRELVEQANNPPIIAIATIRIAILFFVPFIAPPSSMVRRADIVCAEAACVLSATIRLRRPPDAAHQVGEQNAAIIP